tara:strand:- start:49 stop:258 length:210 start_codon:yes stop_codon:yes gene_type:complete
MFEIIETIVLPLLIVAISVPFVFIFVSKSIDHLSSESRVQSLLKADTVNEIAKIALQNNHEANNRTNYK